MAIFVILPTYRRDEKLDAVLAAIVEQTQPPRAVFVVDNASSPSCASLVRTHAEQATTTEVVYIDPGDNTGPAGGTALGMLAAFEHAADDDWLMRCDDDNPPADHALFDKLLASASDCFTHDPLTAAIGPSGARYDYSRARLTKPARDPDTRYVPVDYLATNFFPLYRVGAVRDVGVFRWDLFFGYTEVEYGLRLRHSGYRVYRLDSPDRKTKSSRKPKVALRPTTWQQYYSLRNHLVLAAEYTGRRASVRIALTAMAKPLLNFPRQPRRSLQSLYWNSIAVAHAALGRMGRTVDPWVADGTLTPRYRPSGAPKHN